MGIDPVLRRQIWQALYDMVAHGTTVIVTTHVMDEARSLLSADDDAGRHGAGSRVSGNHQKEIWCGHHRRSVCDAGRGGAESMKTFAIARRILQQLRRDRRTLMLLLAAPLLLLTLIYWLFGAYGTNQAVALVTGPVQYQKNLEENEVQVIRCSQEEGLRLLETGTVTAVVQLYNDRLYVELDGSSNSAQQVLANCSRRSSLQAVGTEKIVIRKSIITMVMKAYPCLISLALF